MFLSFSFCIYTHGDPPVLHVLTPSSPTRRSSDLPRRQQQPRSQARTSYATCPPRPSRSESLASARFSALRIRPAPCRLTSTPRPDPPRPARSEEHTSELQSLMRISYAVFCLKTTKKKPTTTK